MLRKYIFRLLFILVTAWGANAQTYSIDWFSIDGGGGTSAGGAYAVSGTIGQPDAGAMSGGNYSLVGGFWGGITGAVIGPVPTLSIRLAAGNNVVLSWAQSVHRLRLATDRQHERSGWGLDGCNQFSGRQRVEQRSHTHRRRAGLHVPAAAPVRATNRG